MSHSWIGSGNDDEDQCLTCGITVELDVNESAGSIEAGYPRSVIPCEPQDGHDAHSFRIVDYWEGGEPIVACSYCGQSSTDEHDPICTPIN